MVCAVAVSFKYKIGLDDSLDVVGVHLVGGILGALLIGFVGTTSSPQGVDGFFPAGTNGLFYGGNFVLLGHQAMGVLFTLVVERRDHRRSSDWRSSTRSAGGSAATTR